MAAVFPAGSQAHLHSHNHISFNPFLKSEAQPEQLPSADQSAPIAESLEVTVLWGTNVLSARQLTPPRQFAVGEVGGAGGAGTTPEGAVDFALSSEKLGARRREIVALRGNAPFAIFMADETPRVLEKGRAVDASAAIVDCSDVALGARGIELRQDRVVIIEASGVTFRLAGSEKPETVPRVVFGADRSALTTMGTAAILQGLLVASLAYLTPSMAWGEEDDLDRDRLQLMQQYLHAAAQREENEPPPQVAPPGGGEKGAPAERHQGPEGAAGKRDAAQHGRMAIAGHSEDRAFSKAELMAEAKTIGMIGLLNTLNASDAPTSPWGDVAMGPDAQNAMGDIFSENIGEGRGMGGLGLTGIGIGGGGVGKGIGIDRVGTCMGLNCNGDGFGGDHGRMPATHKLGNYGVRMATNATVSGRLPPDVIQRIVRQNFGRFRACYEIGLRTNPNLEGRVTARFVIGRDGAVSNVSASGDLPDSQVRSCVASAFYGLSFPTPENGIVTVSYPIMLTPG